MDLSAPHPPQQHREALGAVVAVLRRTATYSVVAALVSACILAVDLAVFLYGAVVPAAAVAVALVVGLILYVRSQRAAFGLAWRLTGLARGQSLRITQTIRHPPMTKPDGTTLTEQVSYENLTGDGGPIEGKFWYFFRQEYEVVSGPWVASLTFTPALKIEQQFTLVAQ